MEEASPTPEKRKVSHRTGVTIILQGGSGIILVLSSLSALITTIVYMLAGYASVISIFEIAALGYVILGIFQLFNATTRQFDSIERLAVSLTISFLVVMLGLVEIAWAYSIRFWRSLTITGAIMGFNVIIIIALILITFHDKN